MKLRSQQGQGPHGATTIYLDLNNRPEHKNGGGATRTSSGEWNLVGYKLNASFELQLR